MDIRRGVGRTMCEVLEEEEAAVLLDFTLLSGVSLLGLAPALPWFVTPVILATGPLFLCARGGGGGGRMCCCCCWLSCCFLVDCCGWVLDGASPPLLPLRGYSGGGMHRSGAGAGLLFAVLGGKGYVFFFLVDSLTRLIPPGGG